MRKRIAPNISKPTRQDVNRSSHETPTQDAKEATLRSSQASSHPTSKSTTLPSTTTSASLLPSEKPKLLSMDSLSKKSQWIALAIASGACAAFNGVFAKLTTTELTTTFATWVANLIGLASIEGGVEVVVRITFFLLNLLFNGIMWALFTRALSRGPSTTKVSILNTSSNFMITAVLGALIFSESLPPLWFLGATLLVAGNVIIGRRDEGAKEGEEDERTAGEVRAEDRDGRNSSEEGGRGEGDALLVGGLGEVVDLEDLQRGQEEDDILQLDTPDQQTLRDDLQLL